MLDVHFFCISEKLRFIRTTSFKNDLDCSWITWGILWPPKIKIAGFGARGHVKKSRNRRNAEFGLSHKQIEKLLRPK